MKAKLYIGLISAVMLQGISVKAQVEGGRDFKSNPDENRFADRYDYYYSSRINRFHRSYSTFSYYSPVYTDTYWYNYQPYSLGTSIYGYGGGAGLIFGNAYPVFRSSYGYSDPYYSGSYYWGNTAYYYNGWSPLVININPGKRWRGNNWGGSGQGHYYENVYNRYNYYNASNNNNSFRRNPPRESSINSGNNTNINEKDKSNNGLHLGDTRRNDNPSNGGSSTNLGSRGNQNNANPGNSDNNKRNTDSGQNQSTQGNRENQGNQGNQGNKVNQVNQGNTNNQQNNQNPANDRNNNSNGYQNSNRNVQGTDRSNQGAATGRQRLFNLRSGRQNQNTTTSGTGSGTIRNNTGTGSSGKSGIRSGRQNNSVTSGTSGTSGAKNRTGTSKSNTTTTDKNKKQ